VTCTSSDGTSTAVISGDQWGILWHNAPNWDDPRVGIYSDISINVHGPFVGTCAGKTANCGGTITIQYDYGTPVTYEGETYQTVVIGTQTWLQRNLNYAVKGSKCYKNDEANCATYGRLYDWTTAMALPNRCNSSKCASNLSAKYRGICPEGWHIPSLKDWDNLLQYVYNSVYTLNIYGFSVLLGGFGYSSGSEFNDVGFIGKWWSATEGVDQLAYSMEIMSSISAKTTSYNLKENDFHSVRCLKD